MKRRTFLKTVGGLTGSLALGTEKILSAEPTPISTSPDTVAGLPRRLLGRTGQKLSVVGFPGLALANYDQQRGNEGIRQAFERGVNYFDVAPAYGKDGDAEIKMGIGLQQLDRSRIFLACKTKMRDKEGARLELERSLTRLKTDHFDLYQMHHLVKPEEVKKALGPGGAIETFLKAKEEGKVKYFGFSAHTTKAALEALKGFRFDSVMFPINFVEFFRRDFGKEVLELANQQGIGILAIKPLSHGAWAQGAERKRQWWYRTTETEKEVDLALRFTLSRPGVVAGIPPSFLDLLDKAITAANHYQPPTAAEVDSLRKLAGQCESIFIREEAMVAMGTGHGHPIFPDSPHECDGGGHYA